MSYSVGDRVGDYQIIDVLGAGGMGKVYKVRNVISERIEALKVLLPNLESNPDLADRFMREIKVQASLQHPNIAALHTALRIDNQLLMLIEYVEGVTLDAELRNGPIPVAKAVDYITQVLVALGHAHNLGVVHRDIKPANMMVTSGGVVKLMDFGIARLAADKRLTQTGSTVGSLYYMSPEQIQGAVDLDARSDLYSLGVSLYEIVTARRPFQGDSDYSIMAAHLSATPMPPIEVDPSLPQILNDVILTAIAKEPAKRFQTAEAFKRALGTVNGVPTPSPTPRIVPAPLPPIAPAEVKSRRGLYMAVGSLVTVAVLAVAALQGPAWFTRSEASGDSAGQAPATVPPSSTQGPNSGSLNPSPAPSQNAGTPDKQPSRSAESQPVAQGRRPAPTSPPATQTPAASTPSEGATTPAPSTTPPAQTPAAEKPDPLLGEYRELLMLLGTRVGTVKLSLATIKAQQALTGVNLRPDVQTAAQRMEFFLDEAEASFRANDAAKMKKNLDSAEREIERVEKFLGR